MVTTSPLHTSSVHGSTHLLLGRLRGEDLIQLEGHLLPLVQEVQDSVVVGVEGHRVGHLRALAVLFCDGADSPENTDVSLGGGDAGMVSAPAQPAADRSTPSPTPASHGDKPRTFQPHQLVVTLLAELQLPPVLSQQLLVGSVHLLDGLADLRGDGEQRLSDPTPASPTDAWGGSQGGGPGVPTSARALRRVSWRSRGKSRTCRFRLL